MMEFIQDLCVKMGVCNPQQLAEEWTLLLEASIMTAQVSQRPDAAKIAKQVAKALIDKATI